MTTNCEDPVCPRIEETRWPIMYRYVKSNRPKKISHQENPAQIQEAAAACGTY